MPSRTIFAVDGTPIPPAFIFTIAAFVQPAVGASVDVNTEDTEGMNVGQSVYVAGGGYYRITARTANTLSLLNLSTTNTAPGATIATDAKITAAGDTGSPGQGSYTLVTADFVMPVVPEGPPLGGLSVAVASSAGYAAGQTIYIPGAGYFSVYSVPDSTHVSINNLGYPGNAAPGGTITSGGTMTIVGARGATGAAGPAAWKPSVPILLGAAGVGRYMGSALKAAWTLPANSIQVIPDDAFTGSDTDNYTITAGYYPGDGTSVTLVTFTTDVAFGDFVEGTAKALSNASTTVPANAVLWGRASKTGTPAAGPNLSIVLGGAAA